MLGHPTSLTAVGFFGHRLKMQRMTSKSCPAHLEELVQVCSSNNQWVRSVFCGSGQFSILFVTGFANDVGMKRQPTCPQWGYYQQRAVLSLFACVAG